MAIWDAQTLLQVVPMKAEKGQLRRSLIQRHHWYESNDYQHHQSCPLNEFSIRRVSTAQIFLLRGIPLPRIGQLQ